MKYHNNYHNYIIIGFEILMILLSFIFLHQINKNSNQFYTIEKTEHQMITLAIQLKESSHNLTKFARAYVTTENKEFKAKYFNILKIRNGEVPRPIQYDDHTLDLSSNKELDELTRGKKVSLLSKIEEFPYTQKELNRLKKAKENSNKLAQLEKKAFSLSESHLPNAREQAINLLYSKEYYQSKQNIVCPIHQVIKSVQEKNQNRIKKLKATSQLLFILFLVLLTIFIVVNIYIGYYLLNKDKALFNLQQKLLEENAKNHAIFNLQKSIIIVRDNIHMTKANDAFFKTFKFKSLDDFSSKHSCISELFISKPKEVPHLQQMMGELNWLEYIQAHPEQVHEVYIEDQQNKERIFSVELRENVYHNRSMVVFNDITELKHQYETFKRLFETSSDGLLIMKNRKFIAVNNTLVKMLNYKNREEILKLNPLALLPSLQSDDRKNTQQAYKKTLEQCLTQGFSSIEGIHQKATGQEFWCDLAMTKIKIQQEDAIYIRWRDIDEYKKLQFSLQEQVDQQAKALITHSRLAGIGEVMQNITHQWKQPLSIILNLVGLLKLEVKENSYLNIIEDQTKYLNKTISDFNSFSANSKSEQSHFNLEKSIQVTLNVFEFQATTYNIRIDADISATAMIQGEIAQFNQALLVILSNAKDALVENQVKERYIRLTTKECTDYIILTISDNGNGVPLDIIDKIFEPYFTTKFKDKGKGIGLSMTYNIMQKSNSKIQVHNNTEGAVFTITIPKFKTKETS